MSAAVACSAICDARHLDLLPRALSLRLEMVKKLMRPAVDVFAEQVGALDNFIMDWIPYLLLGTVAIFVPVAFVMIMWNPLQRAKKTKAKKAKNDAHDHDD